MLPGKLPLEELLDDELELDELELEDEELEDDEDELELVLLPGLISAALMEPSVTERTTLSRPVPSSRRCIQSVCLPAATLSKLAGFKYSQPSVPVLFWVFQSPESSL